MALRIPDSTSAVSDIAFAQAKLARARKLGRSMLGTDVISQLLKEHGWLPVSSEAAARAVERHRSLCKKPARGDKLTNGHILELVAAAAGFPTWNHFKSEIDRNAKAHESTADAREATFPNAREATTGKFYDPLKPLEFIDEIADRWKDTLVAFLTHEGGDRWATAGSGFLVAFEGRIFLVTALHVLGDERDGRHIYICGRHAALENKLALVDRKNDIAAFYLPDKWLVGLGVARLKSIPIPDDLPLDNDLITLAWGFPATKNKIAPRHGRTDLRSISVTLGPQRSDVLNRQVGIEKPLTFHFNRKEVSDSHLRSIGFAPDLHGMSGGPVVALVTRTNSEVDHYMPKLMGVLCEGHAQLRCVVAAQLDCVIAVLKRLKLRVDEFGPDSLQVGSSQ